VLDVLSRLVDKSLVSVERGPDGMRYRRLTPTREYAAEKLARSGEEAMVRDRHAAFYLALAEKAEPELVGAGQAAWLDRLERDRANLGAALRWLIGRQDAEGAQRLAGALWRFWYARGPLAEGRRWLDRALALDGPPMAARGKALNGAGQLARFQGDYVAAEARFQAALEVRRAVGDPARVADTTSNLGYLALLRRDYARAGELFTDALRRREQIGDNQGVAYSWSNLADVAFLQGNAARARGFAERARAAHRAVGNATNVGMALTQQARMALAVGDVEEAYALAGEGLAWFHALGHHSGVAYARRLLGQVALRQGDLTRAREHFSAALVDRWDVGDLPSVADALAGLAGLAVAGRQVRHAARLIGAALAIDEARGCPLEIDRAVDREAIEASLRDAVGPAYAALRATGGARHLAEVVAEALDPPPEDEPVCGDPLARLTAREREVAFHLARRETNRQIAVSLGVAPRTVDTHVARVLRKLGVDRREDVVALVAGVSPRLG
jgi:DNA-binding CsgD family transcriptional regulator/Tfp pilus assembly protein PilF